MYALILFDCENVKSNTSNYYYYYYCDDYLLREKGFVGIVNPNLPINPIPSFLSWL